MTRKTASETATPLSEMIDARLSRRSALKGLLACGAATVVAPMAHAATQARMDPSSLQFAQAPHNIEMFHQVAAGHRADVLIRWGDKVLRNAPDSRIRPYRDFSEPRARAASNPRNRIHGGKSIAWFTRKGQPHTLRFAGGYAPDFVNGVLESRASASSLYGGDLMRYHILSHNREVQYLFFASPRQVWIIPPQATTTEIMSYGVRTVGVVVDEDLCVPGYEYHYLDHSVSPPEMVSQIPAGYVGKISAVDPSRADASPWLDELPVIQEFRRKVL